MEIEERVVDWMFFFFKILMKPCKFPKATTYKIRK